MFCKKPIYLALIFIIVVALTACGGGSSSSSNQPSAPIEKPPVVEQPPVAEKPKCPRPIHPWENYMAVGDSITMGTGDDVASDNIAGDGCYKGRGFPPVLIDKLERARGKDYVVINRGVGGATSGAGAQSIGGLVGGETMHYLILYGANDSIGAADGKNVSVKQFKQNLQVIINKIHSAGKNAFLAKIPPVLGDTNNGPKYRSLHRGARNELIRLYNRVIDELVRENGISIAPPDLYNYFKDRLHLYFDNVHPNGDGYRHIAELWARKLKYL